MDQAFEHAITTPTPVFSTCLNGVKVSTLDLSTRKSKARAIGTFVLGNKGDDQPTRGSPASIASHGIQDVHWTKNHHTDKGHLKVDFVSPEHANEALARGLSWGGKVYVCEILDHRFRLIKCEKWLDYGHTQKACLAPKRCPKCAGTHLTRPCPSRVAICAVCGGDHRAKSKICPARIGAKNLLRFDTSQSATYGQPIQLAAPSPRTASNLVPATPSQTALFGTPPASAAGSSRKKT